MDLNSESESDCCLPWLVTQIIDPKIAAGIDAWKQKPKLHYKTHFVSILAQLPQCHLLIHYTLQVFVYILVCKYTIVSYNDINSHKSCRSVPDDSFFALRLNFFWCWYWRQYIYSPKVRVVVFYQSWKKPKHCFYTVYIFLCMTLVFHVNKQMNVHI